MAYDHDGRHPPTRTTEGHTRPRDDRFIVTKRLAERYGDDTAFLFQTADEVRDGTHRWRAIGHDYVAEVKAFDARQGTQSFKIPANGHTVIAQIHHAENRIGLRLEDDDPVTEWVIPTRRQRAAHRLAPQEVHRGDCPTPYARVQPLPPPDARRGARDRQARSPEGSPPLRGRPPEAPEPQPARREHLAVPRKPPRTAGRHPRKPRT